MSLLKQLLMDKKFFEMEDEVDKLIEKNKVEPGSLGQRLEFSKDVFTDSDQVHDFLRVHIFENPSIKDVKGKYNVILIDEIGFIESTMQTIEVREGVDLVVGILKPMSADNPVLFSGNDGIIKLSSDVPYIIELANVVNGFHANFGEVSISSKDLISFKNNFDNQVVGVDLMIDFDHETREAAGWIKEVFLSDDGDTLLGLIKWTPKGVVSLTGKEFRYLSPEFTLNWVHPHTGVAHGPTLLGAGLVNRPFLKMDAIVELNKGKTKGVPQMETVTLADHNKKVITMQEQVNEITLSEATAIKSLKTIQEKNVSLSEENKTLKNAAEKKEKEDKHNLLFSEGKINKAQLDALNEGKDMLDVLALNEKLNTEPTGDGGADNQSVKLSDAEKALCKKLGLTDKEFYDANKVEA